VNIAVNATSFELEILKILKQAMVFALSFRHKHAAGQIFYAALAMILFLL
jgi:hypothetical protein